MIYSIFRFNHLENMNTPNILCICGLVCILVLIISILTAVCCKKRKFQIIPTNTSESFRSRRSPMTHRSTRSSPFRMNRERFVVTPNKAVVTPTGAIISNGIQTNQMMRGDVSELAKIVNANGYVAEGQIDPGVVLGQGFEEAYTNQQNIINIGDKAQGGYETQDQLKEITMQITATNNNANQNLFNRAGDRPTKLYLAPNEVRCVIDEKYMSERDKNQQVSVVGTIIPTQGYDLNIERIGENLLDTHFSAVSCNKNRTRIPTKAGAAIINNVTKEIESPNEDALSSAVDVIGDKITINDITGDGKNVAVALDETVEPPESFRARKYVRR